MCVCVVCVCVCCLLSRSSVALTLTHHEVPLWGGCDRPEYLQNLLQQCLALINATRHPVANLPWLPGAERGPNHGSRKIPRTVFKRERIHLMSRTCARSGSLACRICRNHAHAVALLLYSTPLTFPLKALSSPRCRACVCGRCDRERPVGGYLLGVVNEGVSDGGAKTESRATSVDLRPLTNQKSRVSPRYSKSVLLFKNLNHLISRRRR